MNKTYAFSDIHGMYDLWSQIRDYCDDTDIIYFLGDAADRGDNGVKILDELLSDPRVIFLKGNHEDMFTICVPEFEVGDYSNLYWWGGNGGQPTLKELTFKTSEEVKELVSKLKQLPTSMWYDSPCGHRVFLSHAGTDLRFTEKELIMMGRPDPYIWDRKHFHSPKSVNMENIYQVHGHTPTILLAEELGLSQEVAVLRYCDGHKIDIDLGSFNTGVAALIDLDSFEVKYFTKEK